TVYYRNLYTVETFDADNLEHIVPTVAIWREYVRNLKRTRLNSHADCSDVRHQSILVCHFITDSAGARKSIGRLKCHHALCIHGVPALTRNRNRSRVIPRPINEPYRCWDNRA